VRTQPSLVAGNVAEFILISSIVLTILLNGIRDYDGSLWNLRRETIPAQPEEADGPHPSLPGHRPKVGRERDFCDCKGREATSGLASLGQSDYLARIRTWAYGHKILAIRLVYLLLFALARRVFIPRTSGSVCRHVANGGCPGDAVSFEPDTGQCPGGHVVDQRARRPGLDLLLVTDLTPKRSSTANWAAFFQHKEMVVLPLLLCIYMWMNNTIGLENALFLMIGLAVLYFFVAVLGVHAGITYANSGSAIAASLGTVFSFRWAWPPV